jgi:hypothetical protein
MDDIDREIVRAKIGRREEPLNEAIERIPKKPIDTNYQPMESIKKVSSHICDTCDHDTGIWSEARGIKKILCRKTNRMTIKYVKNDYCRDWKAKTE